MWQPCGKSLLCTKMLRKCSKSPWTLLPLSFCSSICKKTKLAPLQERRMIDKCRLYAKGGDGGNGCTSFRRSRHDRHGRPDGGSGGKGGDVILECSPAVWDFSSLQHHANAKRGGHGSSKNRVGTRGADRVVLVPVGTVLHLVEGELPCVIETQSSSQNLDPWDVPGMVELDRHELDRHFASHGSTRIVDESSNKKGVKALSVNTPHFSESDQTSRIRNIKEEYEREEDGAETEREDPTGEEIEYNVAELTEKGQRIIVARGGEGGPGNVLSTTVRKKPEIQKDCSFDDTCITADRSSSGLPGSEVVLILELKSIADVGLVGMPNAGKSTILGALSRASPTVGHYAFTTLRPNLGNLSYDDLSITLADIPGLIKGAHENRGLGHAFLRHIERTKVLAYVVDLAAHLDGRKGSPPWKQLEDLIIELDHHQEGLSSRPALVVANKIDEVGAERVYEELRSRVEGAVPIFPVCAVLEEGIPELKQGLRMLVNGDGESYRLTLDRVMLE